MDWLVKIKECIGKEFKVSPSPFMGWLKPVVLAVEVGHLEFEYTIRPEWLNPIDNLHGGIIAAIMDDILGATMFTFNEDDFYITLHNSIDYLSIAKNGDKIIASTKIIKKGKQFVLAECEIWSSKRSRLIAKGTSNLYKTSVSNK
ncbi:MULTISPECIES: PaaI family thioesterase [Sphingobacterium]|uniref:PaaI family thioesterase n=1 Tax=Sphingobacterium TaxID=28453 RepID=UPI00104E2F1E|nr:MULTISPECIES: PaaI family thioesterase [Sphingobacterium]MCW2263069.1 acyl-coenzyme A thioesterase 13 [Sphingobacterium kitahiroshimense]TCR11941.1 uncharacterized protein (TIGR00369 family) [Sphingobacterium sp. JUb78]